VEAWLPWPDSRDDDALPGAAGLPGGVVLDRDAVLDGDEGER